MELALQASQDPQAQPWARCGCATCWLAGRTDTMRCPWSGPRSWKRSHWAAAHLTAAPACQPSAEDNQYSFHPAAVSLKERSFHGLSPGASCPGLSVLKGSTDFLGNTEQVNMTNKCDPNMCLPVFLHRRKTCLTFTIKTPFRKLFRKEIIIYWTINVNPQASWAGEGRQGWCPSTVQRRLAHNRTALLPGVASSPLGIRASATHIASHPAPITSNTKPSGPWAAEPTSCGGRCSPTTQQGPLHLPMATSHTS